MNFTSRRARRIRRLIGAAMAVCLSWSAAGAAVAPPLAPAGCCCKARGAACHCPACEHAREIASGDAHLRSCRGGPAEALLLAAQAPFLHVPAPAPLSSRPPQPACGRPATTPGIVREVPTPPPLG